MLLLVASLLLCVIFTQSELDDHIYIPRNLLKKTDRNIFGDCPHIHTLFNKEPILERAILRYGGDRTRHVEVFELLDRHKRNNESTHILFTGSSVTTMGYFVKFTEYLETEEGRNLTIVNKGKGASDVLYHLYCVNYEDSTPDIIFAEIRFLDYVQEKRATEGFIRKLLSLRRRDGGLPLVVFVNMGHIADTCDYPQQPKLNDFAGHYGLTMIDACLLMMHCFGRNNNKKYHLYAPDKIHPNTELGREFLADILKEWWKSAPLMYKKDSHLLRPRTPDMLAKQTLPDFLYPVNAINVNSRTVNCKVVNDIKNTGIDSLKPLTTKGFKVITRVKQGAMGFQNTKHCLQGDAVGDYITFAFYGSHLQVAVYQGPFALGVMAVYIDGEPQPRKTVSSYFEGYEWSKGNGRQYILPLFDDLTSENHTVTFIITNEPANPQHPGHTCQIVALMW